jgi:serine O-acetyltransferase
MTYHGLPQPTFWQLVRGDAARLFQGKPSRGQRLLALTFNRGFHALILHRMSHGAWKCRIPIVPMILTRLAQFLFAVDIAYQAQLGPGIVIVHGFGLVVGSAVRIEGNCCLFHGVTLGDRGSEWVGSSEPDGHPVVEAGCIFGAGAKVLGPIRIGRNSVIGANAVVLKDVPPSSTMAGVPARVIGRRPEMDENLRPIHPQPVVEAVHEAEPVPAGVGA